MRFKAHVVDSHQILQVVIADDAEFIAKAEHVAQLKASNVNVADPAGRNRQHAELLSQNFLGVVADMACAETLSRYFVKHGYTIAVERYDDVRADDFKNSDLYDIKLKHDKNEYIVEVRSSACIYLSLADMIRKWQILGPYTSDVKGNSEDDKSFYMRPLFHLNNYLENRKSKAYNRESGMDAVKSGILSLYIVGGATSELLRQKGRNEQGEELKQGRAEFRVMDILEGLDAEKFLSTIVNDICSD